VSLGDFFPKNLRDSFAKRNVDLGSSLLIRLNHLNVNYPKYIVVIGKDEPNDDLGYVIINTDVNTNVYSSPYLQGLNVPISSSDHDFLDWDSHVDCTKINQFRISDVVNFITSNPDRLVGNLTNVKLKEVLSSLIQSNTISRELKAKFDLRGSLASLS
jgi:hypothetical protein